MTISDHTVTRGTTAFPLASPWIIPNTHDPVSSVRYWWTFPAAPDQPSIYPYYQPILTYLPVKENVMKQKRLVQVYVVDPDNKVSDEHSILYKSEPFLTSKEKQDILVDVPLKDLIKKHNEEIRAKTIDEEKTESNGLKVYLKPINASDLKIEIIELAVF